MSATIATSKHTIEGAPPAAGPRRAIVWGIATGAGVGYAPVASGTFGAALGVAIYWPLAGLGALALVACALALLAAGVWAADEAERLFDHKDDGRIVIDEVVGQLLSLAPLAALGPPSRVHAPAWLLAGFLLFRLFDVWKPGPIGWAERNFRGGLGVMLDDVLAGLLTALILGAGLVLL